MGMDITMKEQLQLSKNVLQPSRLLAVFNAQTLKVSAVLSFNI
jgi:hypothetical protein